MTEIVAASTPEDPALRFIRRELAPERWIATLACTGPAVIGVIAAVTFRIPYPVLFFMTPPRMIRVNIRLGEAFPAPCPDVGRRGSRQS